VAVTLASTHCAYPRGDGQAELTDSAFNRLGQYASSPDNRASCYSELSVSSPVVAVTIASTHCAYPRGEGQAELTDSAFNRLGQYASSPGNRACCYSELSVSSPAVAVTIASTHCAYPRGDGQAELTDSAFNRLGQYASSPGNRACCYSELFVSSPAVAVTIASTHCAYPRGDGQAELTDSAFNRLG